MSKDLTAAREMLEAALETNPELARRYQERALWQLLFHLEAQAQPAETPSETSSAPTDGTVVKRYGLAYASLATSQEQLVLTVETGDYSKSISCTADEWAAIRQLFSTPPPTSESLMPSTPTPEGGDRGVASPELIAIRERGMGDT